MEEMEAVQKNGSDKPDNPQTPHQDEVHPAYELHIVT